LIGRRQRGRPVSEKLDRDFIEAAMGLLKENGSFEAVSIDAVSARAGASKASFYRRWPDRDRFILTVIESLRQPPLPNGPSASLRSDLIEVLDGMFGYDPERTRLVHAAVAARGRKNKTFRHLLFRDVVAPRRKALLDRIRLAIAEGDLDPGLDVTIFFELLTAPILKVMMLTDSDQPIPHRLAERVVDQALRGALPRAAPGGRSEKSG
jgi:AcrR family transcriptional regulator